MPLSWRQASWAAASIYNCCDEPQTRCTQRQQETAPWVSQLMELPLNGVPTFSKSGSVHFASLPFKYPRKMSGKPPAGLRTNGTPPPVAWKDIWKSNLTMVCNRKTWQ